MGFWDWASNLITGNKPDITPITGASGRGADFFISGGEVKWLGASSENDYRLILETCSPIAAIISRKADAFANGNIEILNRATQNYTRGQYKEWDRLIARPNPMQTKTDFLKQLYTYMMMRGYCYALPFYPEGYTDRPSAIWLLPPWLVTVSRINYQSILLTNQIPDRTITLNISGTTRSFNESQLMLFRDSSGLVDEYTLLPQSRLKSLQKQITNLIGGLDSRATLIQRRGAIGILSNDDQDEGGNVPMKKQEKEELQADYRRYGMSGDAWQVIITNAKLKWQSMVIPTKDLMLMEEHEADVRDMCDRLNYPYELLSLAKGVTYANKEEAKKILYQDAIIPESIAIIEQLNEGLKTPDQNIEIVNSYDHVEALQDSVETTANGRKANNTALLIEYEAGCITLDDWRDENGLDKMKKPPFNLFKWEAVKWLQDNDFTSAPVALTTNTELTNIQNTEDGSNSKVGAAAPAVG